MKSAIITVVLVLATWAGAFAQTGENAILGTWESDKEDVRIEVFKQAGKYCGKYLWGKSIVENDGVTSKKDVKNPKPELRNRNVVGITSLTGLKWNGREYVDGKIYDAPSGDTYSCKIWIKDGKLNLRGYLGVSVLGQTATFHRYSE